MSPSMFSLFAAGLAALTPLVSAYTTPTGDAPKGNPISQPGLNTIVPVDKSFKITWEPTTEGTVSLILLKGPAQDLHFVWAIAEKIDNSGSYTWTPQDDLAPTDGPQGYGIQLIDDATGQYQYTTQFGISNDHYEAKASSSASEVAAPSAYAAAPSSYAASPSSYAAGPSSYAAAPSSWVSSAKSSAMSSAASEVAPVSSAVTTSAAVVAPVVTASAPYEIPNNTTAMHATGTGVATMSTKAASPTGGNSTSVEPSTGGASNMAASFGGLVLAAGVAVFAL